MGVKIGGFQKFSMIDYPGKTCAIIFTIGCTFRCRFCHNPELVEPGENTEEFNEEQIVSFLKSRIGKLDAVAITGGEPTIHIDLPKLIKKIKKLGFLVKLDTTGINPRMVRRLIEAGLINYVAMDIKAPFETYANITQRQIRIDKIQETVKLLMNSNVDYEFRTTVAKALTQKQDIVKIAEQIKGAKRYVIQKFVSSKAMDSSLLYSETYSDLEFEEIYESVKHNFEECFLR